MAKCVALFPERALVIFLTLCGCFVWMPGAIMLLSSSEEWERNCEDRSRKLLWGNFYQLNTNPPSNAPIRAERSKTQSIIALKEPSSLPSQSDCIPRPPNIQKLVDDRHNQTDKKLIYYHDGPSIGRHRPFVEWYLPGNKTLDCYQCDSTTDEDRAVEADVVVVLYRKKIEYGKSKSRRLVDGSTQQQLKRTPPKYCGQLFVMVQTEAANNIDPQLTPKEKYEESKVFDISSTFRLDSDLPRPYYANLERSLKKAKENYVPVELRDVEFPVAWIASRCDTTNERMGYVQELMKHIGVKSYGKCLNNAQMDVPRNGSGWKAAANAQIAPHKFYLAFENSNCDYYVTEKLYRALAMGVIPIIMGAPQAHLYVPNNHSALLVQDFDSPQALAQRMHEINRDDELFRYYTSHVFNPQNVDEDFRQLWLQTQPPHACSLCNLVRDKSDDDNNKKSFRGVPYEFWESCEQIHGTWKTNFTPVVTPNGIVPKKKRTGH